MIDRLEKWRNDRNITEANYKGYFRNIIEELLEPMYSKNAVDFLKNEIVDKYFVDDVVLDEIRVIDTINDISVFSINEVGLMGYDFEKTMGETIKEIESRKGEINPETKKFEKFKDDYHQSLWYKAEYSKCKCGHIYLDSNKINIAKNMKIIK